MRKIKSGQVLSNSVQKTSGEGSTEVGKFKDSSYSTFQLNSCTALLSPGGASPQCARVVGQPKQG